MKKSNFARCHCSVSNKKQWYLAKKKKFSLKFCIKKVSWSQNVYRGLRTKADVKLLPNSDQTGTVDCKPGSGKKCMARIAQNVDSVEELV